jgi:2-aminoadipate transaminase
MSAGAVTADDVIVTNGAQQAIALATELVARRGETVAVQAATYPAALDLFRSRGLRPALLGTGRIAYLLPALGNPTGRPLADAEHDAVARARWIIEDDAYADLRFAGGAPPPWLERHRTRVLHVGTFSKTLCPGLRVGWLVVPRSLRRRAVALKQSGDLQSNSLAQAVVDDYLAHVDFDRRLAVLRVFYRRRAAKLFAAIRRALPSWSVDFPDGGFSLWLEADARVDERRLLRNAVAEGMCFDLGSNFQAHAAAGGGTRLRVCYSTAPVGSFDAAARRLARAWAKTSRERRR